MDHIWSSWTTLNRWVSVRKSRIETYCFRWTFHTSVCPAGTSITPSHTAAWGELVSSAQPHLKTCGEYLEILNIWTPQIESHDLCSGLWDAYQSVLRASGCCLVQDWSTMRTVCRWQREYWGAKSTKNENYSFVLAADILTRSEQWLCIRETNLISVPVISLNRKVEEHSRSVFQTIVSPTQDELDVGFVLLWFCPFWEIANFSRSVSDSTRSGMRKPVKVLGEWQKNLPCERHPSPPFVVSQHLSWLELGGLNREFGRRKQRIRYSRINSTTTAMRPIYIRKQVHPPARGAGFSF